MSNTENVECCGGVPQTVRDFILSGEWVTLYLELAQLEGQFYQLNMFFFLCDVMDYNLGMEGQGH